MATLYVSDLDGTLIRDDLTLSPWSRRTLCELLDAGVAITIATARSIASLSSILGDIPFRLPVVEFNGAFLTDYATRRHRLIHSMATPVAHAVFESITRAGMVPFLSTFDGSRDLLFYREATNDGAASYLRERVSFADERLRRTDDLAAPLEQRVICFTVIDREEPLAALERRLAVELGSSVECTLYAYRYDPGWHFLSVHDARATKDRGIRALQDACGLQDTELVVFGDDVNDRGMFRIATRGVAVANARNDIKAMAHEVIGSNQEDSVLRWIVRREQGRE